MLSAIHPRPLFTPLFAFADSPSHPDRMFSRDLALRNLAMRRAAALCIVLFFAIGCGGHAFKDKAEEAAYLKSLSNPTPEQWKRREALSVELKMENDRRPPKVGEIVTIPESAVVMSVYDGVEWFRALKANLEKMMKEASQAMRHQNQEYDKHFVGDVWKNDRVRVLEIGPDWVKILALTDDSGHAKKVREDYEGPATRVEGYTDKWWEKQ